VAAGRRRRSPGAVAAIALILLAPLAVGTALWVVLTDDDRAVTSLFATGTPQLAGGAGPSASAPAESGSLQPRSPAPLRGGGADAFEVDWRRPPRAALVFDVDSGDVLYRHRPRRVLPIASLTKIMTALAVTQSTRPGEVVRIPRRLRYEGSAVGLLPRGRRVRIEPLLGGLVIVSGNDAALALAAHVSGDERRFVALMNEKARLWGLECTRFASPHGLDDGDRSCPADLAVLTRLAMRERRIARIARRAEAAYRFPIRGHRLYLTGHNPLIRAGYRGAIGLKTGYTAAAGRCFVGVARRGRRTLGVVLLHSPDPGRQATRLLDRAFATP
jgi:serine-type D-Ala-D-Ala carboxypeptidase (penicillin-binding protein 5/6)